MKKIVSICFAIILSFMMFFSYDLSTTSYAATDPVVIVIDPGHGGTGDRNLGAQYNGYSEKEITLKVAKAMKAYLEKFDNVVVYLTRTTDTYVSLADRAKFAASVNADFMYSIHFNASVEHDLCGSEIWISAYGDYYKNGYEFAYVEQQELMSLGLYQRGIKTKLGNNGDYYGILRNARAYGVNCALIEHCYLDQGADLAFLKSSADPYAELGIADATAVAKYFGLKSAALSVDYSSYENISVEAPTTPVSQDLTEPTVCTINSAKKNKKTKTISVNATCIDPDSPIIYYRYSFDNGATWSSVVGWNRALETDTVEIPYTGNVSTLTIECYNQYDLITVSNTVSL